MTSIIVPVYDTQNYLRRCIESILNQKYSDFELILIDDGSKDESPEICDEYAAMDSRIVVVHKDNEGVSVARNIGITISHGEYIGFVDSDDCIDPEMYLSMNSIALKYNSDLIFCNYLSFTNLNEISLNNKGNYGAVHYDKKKVFEGFYDTYDVKYVSCCTKLVKKELLQSIIFDSNLKYGEDNIVAMQLYYKANNIQYIDENLYYYYKNPSSGTHSIRSLQHLDSVKAYFIGNKYWKEYDELYFSSLCIIKGYKLLLNTKHGLKKSADKEEACIILNEIFDSNFDDFKVNPYISKFKKFYFALFRRIPFIFDIVISIRNIFRK